VVEDDVHFAISKEIFGESHKGILRQMPLHFICFFIFKKYIWHQQINIRPMTTLLSFMNESSFSLVGIIHFYFLEIILVVNQLGDNFIMGSIAIFISKKSCYL
jgi:hypothetical protein